jgi:hypothetical protein
MPSRPAPHSPEGWSGSLVTEESVNLVDRDQDVDIAVRVDADDDEGLLAWHCSLHRLLA